jgi:site-specific recombinase XerD
MALMEEFSKDCKLRGMTAESVRRYVSSLRIFLKFLRKHGINLEEVNVQVLKEFLRRAHKTR